MCTENSRVDGAPQFTVSWFVVTVYSGLPRGSNREEQRRVFLYPEVSASSSSTPFVLVGCNSCWTCVCNIYVHTYVLGSLLLG